MVLLEKEYNMLHVAQLSGTKLPQCAKEVLLDRYAAEVRTERAIFTKVFKNIGAVTRNILHDYWKKKIQI